MTKAILKKVNEMGSTYVGDRNAQGLRHGRGRCTYLDGSYYEGEWENDHKQGRGVLVERSGTIYEGEWLNDLRHGNGSVKYGGGDQIKVNFVHDRMHGQGTVYNAERNTTVEAIFFNDMQVNKAD